MNPSKGNTREHQQRIQPPSRASSTRRGDKHNARLTSPSNVDSVSPRQLRPRLEPNRSTFRKNASPKQSRSRLQPNRTAPRRSASPPQSRPQIDPNELAFRRSTFPMPQSRPPLQPNREDFRRDASPTRMRQTLEPNKTASQNIPRGPSALRKREERSHSPPTQGRSRKNGRFQ